MKKQATFLLAGTALWLLLLTLAMAQGGAGEAVGRCRRNTQPEVITLTGRLEAIIAAPQAPATGRTGGGTHVLLKTADGQQHEIRLGPPAAVADVVAKLQVGQEVGVQAFHTDRMPEGPWMAQSLTIAADTFELRDSARRPIWAGRQPNLAAARPGCSGLGPRAATCPLGCPAAATCGALNGDPSADCPTGCRGRVGANCPASTGAANQVEDRTEQDSDVE